MVRFFAMQNRSGYQKPMKDFLSKFMKKNQDPSKGSLETGAQLFYGTCDEIVTSLGERPFHIRSGLNVAVADAVMVAFSQHLGQIPADIAERYDRLKGDEQFDESTKQGTTDVDTVRERFKRAEEVLFGQG